MTDYKEEDDEAFSGTIRPEVMEIVQKNTPIGKILDEEGFALIVVKIIEDLHDWVMETLDGIDGDLLKLFLVDFVQQVIHNTFTVSPSLTDILSKTPLDGAGTSTFTLSVSNSTIGSSAETFSP